MLKRLYNRIARQSKAYIVTRHDMENALFCIAPMAYYREDIQKQLQHNIAEHIISTGYNGTIDDMIAYTEDNIVDNRIYKLYA